MNVVTIITFTSPENIPELVTVTITSHHMYIPELYHYIFTCIVLQTKLINFETNLIKNYKIGTKKFIYYNSMKL